MKKLLLILLCLPMIGFGQSLGSRIEFEYGSKYLSFKQPKDCNLVEKAEANGYIAGYLCNSSVILFKKGPWNPANDSTVLSQLNDPKFIASFVSGFESESSSNVYDKKFTYINEEPSLMLFYNTTIQGQKMTGVSWYIACDKERLVINTMHPVNSEYKEYDEMLNLFSALVNSIQINWTSYEDFKNLIKTPTLTLPKK